MGSSFTTYGPFVVAPETFFEAMTPFSSEINWRVYPIRDNLTVSEVDDLRRELERLEGRLNVGRRTSNQIRLDTGLIDILRETERSLLVTRSSVLILTIQLAVLAGYALLLTAGLLAESRQVETNLLRSRGAGSNQILAMSLMEGILLTIPAAIVAPFLATVVLRALNVARPLSEIDLAINPVVTRASFIIAGVAALGCLVSLALPALRSARQFGNVRAERSRESTRGVVQRAGLDIALIVFALVGFWQLQRFGAPITETVQGRLGIDPLLVAAPALGLVAGGVVALRSLPLISRVAESVTSRSTWLVPALGAWQVARRPLRYARASLLLILATGIGLFSVAYATTWRNSQSDQASFQTGAQLRSSPTAASGRRSPTGCCVTPTTNFPDSKRLCRSSGSSVRSRAPRRTLVMSFWTPAAQPILSFSGPIWPTAISTR
ncbi:MAG: FtsX-like permease family protein [Thermomicrobiales bacterium]